MTASLKRDGRRRPGYYVRRGERAVAKFKKEARLRKHDDMMAAAKQPSPGWKLISIRQFSASGYVFPVGSEIPEAVYTTMPSKHFNALIGSGYCRWVPGSAPISAKPRALQAPTQEKPRPKVELAGDASRDPVQAWRDSLKLMTERCAGDRGLAEDLLLADQAGGRLYQTAARVFAENKSRSVPGMCMRRTIDGLNG